MLRGNRNALSATILLIRHAAHPHLGDVLSGRTPGIALSPDGQRQALALSQRLHDTSIDLIQTSPVQRARETAAVLAEAYPALEVEPAEPLDELDFGDWSGRKFVELAGDPLWDSWNRERARAVAPNGESMAAAQGRAWAHVRRTALAHSDRTVAMVTHCDIIRAIVARVLEISLDGVHRFEIGPASVSRIVVGSWGAKVLTLNEGGHE